MSEEIDLTKAKWNLDEEVYLQSVKESIKDNYPDADLEKELEEINLTESDLHQRSKLNKLLNILARKYPDA
jgi:hypothetical protein